MKVRMKWHGNVALLPQEFLEVAKILVALWGRRRREMTTFVAGRGLECSVMIAVTRRGDPCNHGGCLSIQPSVRPSVHPWFYSSPTVSLTTWRHHPLHISFLPTPNFHLNCDHIPLHALASSVLCNKQESQGGTSAWIQICAENMEINWPLLQSDQIFTVKPSSISQKQMQLCFVFFGLISFYKTKK